MRIRVQTAGVIDLHRLSGAQDGSTICKSTWTDRRGEEHSWWHHVESRPGAGYPAGWEDESRFPSGGWDISSGRLELRQGSPAKGLIRLFHQPDLPVLDDYYEPWDYDVARLTAGAGGLTQARASTRSQITGEALAPRGGPNWDADGAGAESVRRDPLLAGFSEQALELLESLEQRMRFSLPRLCNHCLNPSCVAACPSGAMQKRGEDGVVLVDQVTCRGWTSCVPACPYQKVYYNWAEGKASKCNFCFPLLERAEIPFCFGSSSSGSHYLGVLLYDQERIDEVARMPESQLVSGLRGLFLDPANPLVKETALRQGIPEETLNLARRSPVYALLIDHRVALPLHIEYRTLPAIFYIPPLLTLASEVSREAAMVVERYLASLFSAGQISEVADARARIGEALRSGAFSLGKTDPGVPPPPEKALELFRLLTAGERDRFVLPGSSRGMSS